MRLFDGGLIQRQGKAGESQYSRRRPRVYRFFHHVAVDNRCCCCCCCFA